ncbi:MAG: hypothetical protein WAV98_00485 [Minisyncoccia bacterium]
MEATFDSEEGKLILCFKPEETDEVSVHMQLLLEDESSKGHPVPNFGRNFFMDLATSRKKARVVFKFKHLGFAICFIEELLDRTTDDCEYVETLGHFLD